MAYTKETVQFRGHRLTREIKGVSQRWHVSDGDGVRLTRLGYKSLAAAKRSVDEQSETLGSPERLARGWIA